MRNGDNHSILLGNLPVIVANTGIKLYHVISRHQMLIMHSNPPIYIAAERRM
jgi:hypothetical protein